jgi:hypothetical protein
MGITNYGRQQLALLIAGSGDKPLFCGIGSGSGTFTVTDSGLIYQLGSRAFYTTRDISVLQEVFFQFDYSSVLMSGLTLREFGIGTGSGSGNNLWNRETLNAVTFDGNQELQIQTTYRIY